MFRRPVRAGVCVAACVMAVLLLATDAAVLAGRVGRLHVEPSAGQGRTWVLVGLDSRGDLPDGAAPGAFGTAADVPGTRADVVVVLQETASGLTVLSVPRDVVVSTSSGPSRLALTWLHGPQATVEGLCDLGIPTGHLVTVDLAGFAAVVDAAGGVDVDVPAAVRDPAAGLELPRAGVQHLDGTTALALVRSRHPEHRVGGRWVAVPPDADGRAVAAGTVLRALSAAAQHALWGPWGVQSLAWAASGALTVDDGTSLPRLAGLLGDPVDRTRVLPVGAPVGGTVVRFRTGATEAAVRAAGLSCDG